MIAQINFKLIPICPSAPHSNANVISFPDTQTEWGIKVKTQKGFDSITVYIFCYRSRLCLHKTFHDIIIDEDKDNLEFK